MDEKRKNSGEIEHQETGSIVHVSVGISAIVHDTERSLRVCAFYCCRCEVTSQRSLHGGDSFRVSLATP